MHKIALVLAIVAIGEGLIALHLVGQLQEEREAVRVLQAQLTELQQKSQQAPSGAASVAVPTQPTASPSGSSANPPPAADNSPGPSEAAGANIVPTEPVEQAENVAPAAAD